MGKACWVAAVLALLPWAAAAGGHAAMQAQSVRAVRVARPPLFDGGLDDPAWASAAPIERFYETYPGDRTPAPEHTEVRLLYDDRYLYVGLRMDLRDTARLREPFVRRDKVNASHDYVQIYLDPQGTRRGSYLFRVDARGVKTDGYQNEAQQTETLDPDYDWDVATRVGARGWTAEMRIPLTTLRIARRGRQRWAVVVTRGVPRDENTQMASAPFPHDASCFLCYAGTVQFDDLEPHAEPVLLTPGLTITRRHEGGSYGHADDLRWRPSFDAKWLPRPGAALDVTVHPDFSQVEADQAQLTANQRFALDLPEKRPFFREGADLVTTLIPAVYTRSVAAPDWGLRYTRRSDGLEGTAFLARDGGRPAIIEPGFLGSSLVLPDFDSRDGFARLRQTLAHGDAGALLAVKDNDDGSRNRVAGVDGSWADSTDRLIGQWLESDTRDPNRPDLAADWRGQSLRGSALWLEWDHSTRNVWTLRYQRYDPGFRSWLGYVPRVGYQALHYDYNRPFYSTAKWINTIEPYVWIDRVQGIGGQRGHEFDPALGLVLAGWRDFAADIRLHPDASVLDGNGRERHVRYVEWKLGVNPAPRIPALGFTGSRGRVVDYASGDVVPGTTWGLHLVTRPWDRLELEWREDRSLLDRRPGEAHRLTEAARQFYATWYFSARLYALLAWQRHSTDRRYPGREHYRATQASLQFNWDWSRDLQLYWGVRGAGEYPDDRRQRGHGSEVYFKLAWTWRPGT
ncbi:sugar-binding protein [Fulvimonas sp. R45]|uniref:carbohydrate binding family 9 domain-containing protein n=1 Tax=Fulvimonas sp. R45 TaxID=3045937 RepID=UPI0026604E98|nr:sugar-binding protein [Fulvimonas sp. R45]MDO1529645.1 sugar-binding protein [Fulvimonas sp. R45]